MQKPGTYCLRCEAPDPTTTNEERFEAVCSHCGAVEERVLIIDPAIKSADTPRGSKHWTVGALLEREGKFLLMRKKTWPYLWDVIAGHLGPDEDPADAVARELEEETGLRIKNPTVAFHGEIFPDPCRRGVNIHEWTLFRGEAVGDPRPDTEEVAELRFLTKQEMLGLPFVRPAYAIFDAIHFWDDVKKKPADSE